MAPLLTVPREPLARFRLLALCLALLVTAGNAGAILFARDLAGIHVATGAASSLLLSAWWLVAYRRGSLPLWTAIPEAGLLTIVAVSSPLPMRALALFYGAIQLRALYSRPVELLGVLIAFTAARFASVIFAINPGLLDAPSATIAFQMTALSLIGGSLNAFVQAIARQESTERALKASDERYRIVTSATRDVIYDYDLQRGTIEWSDSMLSVLGYYPAQVGRDLNWWLSVIHPDDQEGFRETIKAFQADTSRRLDSYQYRVARADGSYAAVSGNALMQRDDAGNPIRVIGAIRDVTVESQLAEQLRQSQKMEAVGQLAGGVAHDFNNLLTVIGGHVYMLEQTLRPGESIDRHLKGITRTADRAAALTRQLLAFSRRQLMKPSVLNANAVVDEVIEMVRPAVAEHTRIVTTLDPLLAPVLADSGQLVQVLVNLALNARDAMPSGGTLTIETSGITLSADAGDPLAPSLPPGDYVRIVVRDTGIGMTPTTLARAFEPFFTTKPPGTGTGLGLATAYGIVKQSMGDIRAESTPGVGSAFTVLLPSAKRQAEPVRVPEDAIAPALGVSTGRHVLLVEDDDGVRDFAREVLLGAGYTVHEARNGVHGLEVARDVLSSISLVVTDIVMPQMSGREMVDRLRRERRDLPVLYMTGYTDDAGMLGELRAAEANLLEKPFGAAALARAVTQAARPVATR